MSESTVTKSKVFKEDINLATGGTGAAEEGTRLTSTGAEVTLTKLDASHIKFRTLAKSLDDLVDGGQDITLKPSSITMHGTLTNDAETVAGWVKNNASGIYSGGNSIVVADLPFGIDAAQIADGSVSNTEFQYLNGVTSSIQNQIDAAGTVAASQAEQEAGTEAAKYVAPATQQFHQSSGKAWAKWTGNSTTLLAGYNVASITDGSYKSTVTFTTAFSSAHYAVVACTEQNDVPRSHIANVAYTGQAVGAVQIATILYDGSGSDVPAVHVICMGDQ